MLGFALVIYAAPPAHISGAAAHHFAESAEVLLRAQWHQLERVTIHTEPFDHERGNDSPIHENRGFVGAGYILTNAKSPTNQQGAIYRAPTNAFANGIGAAVVQPVRVYPRAN